MKVFNRRNVLKGGLVGSMAAGFASFVGASHAAEPAAKAPAQNDKNTYGENKGTIKELKIVDLDGSIKVINGSEVCGEYAEKIRGRQVKEIEAIIL